MDAPSDAVARTGHPPPQQPPPQQPSPQRSPTIESSAPISPTSRVAVSQWADQRISPWITNLIAPLCVLAAAAGIVVRLGKVAASARDGADKTPAGLVAALPPVRTTAVISLDETGQTLNLVADGEVVPFQEANVAAEVSGRIVSKSDICEAGQYVRSGDLLMTIDDTDYAIEKERLEKLRQQEYEGIRENEQEQKNTLRLIEVARKDIELQQREVQRLKTLPNQFSTDREVDAAQRALLASTQALVTLENSLKTLKARLGRLQASEQLAVTQLKAAQENLDRTEIRAPIDGVIVREDADVNTFVNRGMPLVTIENTSKVEVDSKMRPDQLYWVLNQRSASDVADDRGYRLPETEAIIEYELSGLENQTYRWLGRLVSYDGIGLDTQTRTVPVRIIVDNPAQNVDARGEPVDPISGTPALVRGMFVSINLRIKPNAHLVVIPAAALQPGNRVFQFESDPGVVGELLGEINDAEAAEAERDAKSRSDQAPPWYAKWFGGLGASDDGDEDENEAATADATDAAASDVNAGNDDSKAGGDKADADATDDDSDAEPAFDPKLWIPGRVIIREGIVPVDSLRFSEDESMHWFAGGEADQAAMTSENRYWVCETDPDVLPAGARVVVSPVGDIEGDQFKARASVSSDKPPVSP